MSYYYTFPSPPPADVHFYDKNCNEITLGSHVEGYTDDRRIIGTVVAIDRRPDKHRFGVFSDDEDFCGHDLSGILTSPWVDGTEFDTENSGCRGWWVHHDISVIPYTHTITKISAEDIANLLEGGDDFEF